MSELVEQKTHGHEEDGAVHAHVAPVALYIGIFVGLLFFTILTVGQSYVDLGKLNLLFVVMIATAKASLVVTFFMHLKYDNRFHATIFVIGLMFIGVFFTYTMNDTDRRGETDNQSEVWVDPRTGLRAPGGYDIEKAEENQKNDAEDWEEAHSKKPTTIKGEK